MRGREKGRPAPTPEQVAKRQVRFDCSAALVRQAVAILGTQAAVAERLGVDRGRVGRIATAKEGLTDEQEAALRAIIGEANAGAVASEQ